jgi:hypothetical protein
MPEERRRSHDRRATEAGALCDELRGLGVDVEAHLRRAVQAERSAQDFIATRGVTLKQALPVVIHRNCICAPSVLRLLFDLLTLGSDEKLLRKCGDVIGRRVFSAEIEARKPTNGRAEEAEGNGGAK